MKKLATLFLVLCLAAFGVGCGGDDDAAGDGGTAGGGTAGGTAGGDGNGDGN